MEQVTNATKTIFTHYDGDSETPLFGFFSQIDDAFIEKYRPPGDTMLVVHQRKWKWNMA